MFGCLNPFIYGTLYGSICFLFVFEMTQCVRFSYLHTELPVKDNISTTTKKNKEYPGVLDLSRNALYSIFSFPSIWSSLWFYHLRFLHSHCKLESYRNTWKSKLSSSSFVNISTWSPKFSSNTMVMISRIIEDSFSNWK